MNAPKAESVGEMMWRDELVAPENHWFPLIRPAIKPLFLRGDTLESTLGDREQCFEKNVLRFFLLGELGTQPWKIAMDFNFLKMYCTVILVLTIASSAWVVAPQNSL